MSRERTLNAGLSTQAVAMTVNTVDITFNRDLDAGSVLANGSQFTFDNGLTASAATAVSSAALITRNARTPVI